MGWYMLPKPGTKTGPCKESCRHIGCATTKRQGESLCPYCKKAIGYGTKIVFLGAAADRLAHLLCEMDDNEADRALDAKAQQ